MELEKMSRQERNTGIIQFPTNLHVVPRQRRLTTPGVTNLGLTLKRERRKSGAKEVFECISAKNFSKLIKYIIIYPRCLENTN